MARNAKPDRTTVKLELTLEETNTIIQALGLMPYMSV